MFVAAFALHLAMFAQGGKAGIKNPLPKSTIDVSKTYFIQGKSSGLVLDVWGGSVENLAEIKQHPLHRGTNQQWKFSSAGDGFYYIKNVKSGKVLDIYGGNTAAGAKLIQYANGGGANQKFRLVQSGNSYQIIASHSNMALDVPGNSKESIQIQQYPIHGGDNQLWNLVIKGPDPTPPPPPPVAARFPDPNKTYKLLNAHGNRALCTLHNGADPGNKGNQEPIIQYDYYGDATQKWRFKDIGNGWWAVINVHSGKALCTMHNSKDPANKGNQEGIIQFDYYGDATQKWTVTSAGNGNYYLINGHGTRALCTMHNSKDPANKGNQEPVIQYDYYGDATQLWKIQVVQ